MLVDVDPDTMNLDPEKIAVTPRTKAILAVHLFGRPARLEQLPDVTVIEDAAGALGARHAGRACGGLGALGCLSFHPRKIVTTGEGGAVTTNDAELADSFRASAITAGTATTCPRPASTTACPTSSARSGFLRYAGSPSCMRRVPRSRPLTRIGSATCRCCCRGPTTATSTAGRPTSCRSTAGTTCFATLRAQGIEAQIGMYALHRLGAYREQGLFPGADRAFERALALPFHSRLTDDDLDEVAAALDKLVSSH